MNRIETMLRIAKSVNVPLIIAGIAAISFSTVATTHVSPGWFRGSFEDVDRISTQDELPPRAAMVLVAPPGAEKPRRGQSTCGECGVVDSVRRVAHTENAPAIYELTVRMRRGAIRVVSMASEGSWRARDRITVIGGENPSGR